MGFQDTGKVYDLNNPYLLDDEKVYVESWFQLPGSIMEYVFWVLSILSIYVNISIFTIFGLSFLANLIVGFINWYWFDLKTLKLLGLTIFHPYITSVVGVAVGIFLFMSNSFLLAAISALVGIFSFLFFELHILLYSFLAQKYKMHPKYVFAKRAFKRSLEFEKIT